MIRLIPSYSFFTIGDDQEYRAILSSNRRGWKRTGGVIFAWLEDAPGVIDRFCQYWGHEDQSIYGVFQVIATPFDLELWPTNEDGSSSGLFKLRHPCQFVLPGQATKLQWLRYWLRTILIMVIYKI